MIKTNQVLSVGWSLFTGIIWEKLRMNQQPSLRLYVKCAIQSENQHHPSAPFIFHAKKVKEALRTRLNGNKITWTETFVRSKIFTKWKTTLNRGTLACYENLPIKPTLKKTWIFFACNHNPPSPQISGFRSIHHLSSNNSENTSHRHLDLPLTRTNHCNSRLL